MYKELQKIENIKLPVLSKSKIIEKHYEIQKTELSEFFIEVYKTYNDFSEYKRDKDKVFDTILNKLKLSENYIWFNNGSYFRELKEKRSIFNKVKDFIKNNDKDEYSYFQVDIIEGSFNVLKMFGQEIIKDKSKIYNVDYSRIESFNKFENYEIMFDVYTQDLIEDLKNKDILGVLKKSKAFRQVIFGNLNPKRFNSYLKGTMNKIDEVLLKVDKDIHENIILQSQDEFIIAIKKTNKELIELFKSEIELMIGDKLPIRLKELSFSLIEEIKSSPKNDAKQYYIEKEIVDGIEIKKTLKGVPKNIYIPMYKKYIMEKDIEPMDLYTEVDGNIYQFVFCEN